MTKYNPETHHRRSIRLKGYDYALPGAYFITICTQNRECLFGNVSNGVMQLNVAGKMIQKWWYKITMKFKNIKPDEFVIMPNHFHGIIFIVPQLGEHKGSPLHNFAVLNWMNASLCPIIYMKSFWY